MSGYSYHSPGIGPNGTAPPPRPYDGPPIPPLVRVSPVSDSFEITPEPFVTASLKRLPAPSKDRTLANEGMDGGEEDTKTRLLLIVRLPGQFWAQGEVDMQAVRTRIGSWRPCITAHRRRLPVALDEQGEQSESLRETGRKERLLLRVKLPGEFFAEGEIDMPAVEARLGAVQS